MTGYAEVIPAHLTAPLLPDCQLFDQEAATLRSRGIASSFSNHLTLLFNETNTDFPGVVVRLCT
jgi:hypothetical protein